MKHSILMKSISEKQYKFLCMQKKNSNCMIIEFDGNHIDTWNDIYKVINDKFMIYDNIRNNQIPKEVFELNCGNIIDDIKVKEAAGYEKYDICVANILAPIIILLQENIAEHIKKGGIFITSGIIDTKEEDVRLALEANKDFEILEINRLGEWCNITARRI